MKMKICLWAALFFCASLSLQAQITTFLYQGRLNDDNGPANGHYDFVFALRDSASGASQSLAPDVTNLATGVTNGLFTVELDFGAAAFNGSARWLEIRVRTNDVNASYDVLTPRQPILAVPYAITAANISGGNSSAVSVKVNGIEAVRYEAGQGGPGYNTPNIIGGDINNTIDSSGIGSSIGGGNNNSIGLGSSHSVIAGGSDGHIASNSVASVIGGGENNSTGTNSGYSVIGGGFGNTVDHDSSQGVIAGGSANTLTGAAGSVISGGDGNQIAPFDSSSPPQDSVIAGGQNNKILGSIRSVVSGGSGNTVTQTGNSSIVGGTSGILSNSSNSTIVGGYANHIFTAGDSCVIGGGVNNVIGNGHAAANYATIPGGAYNLALGQLCFAAGCYAQATNDGAFVWSDYSSVSPFPSAVANEFAVRAHGGVRFDTAGAGLSVDGITLQASGNGFAPGNGSVTAAKLSAANPVAGKILALAPDGVTLVWTNASAVAGSGWGLTGNSGTTPGVDFLGTTDNTPFELRVSGPGVNNQGGMKLVPIFYTTDYAVNLIGGIAQNYIPTTVGGATVAGGGYSHYDSALGLTFYYTNAATATVATVSGGSENLASGVGAVVPGGNLNIASGFCSFAAGSRAQATNDGSFVWADNALIPFSSTANKQFAVRANGGVRFQMGGAELSITNSGVADYPVMELRVSSPGGVNNQGGMKLSPVFYSTEAQQSYAVNLIGGIAQNYIPTTVGGATVAGGGFSYTVNGLTTYSTNAATATVATVSGGSENLASGVGAVVPGGNKNIAGGFCSFAAGSQAQATNDGSFVWADNSFLPFGSTANKQFAVRANGGAVIQGEGDIDHPQLQLTQTANDFTRLRLANPSNSWDIAAGTDGSLRFYTSGFDRAILTTSGLTVNGTFVSASDRNLKENFAPVDEKDVLAKVAAMPVSRWNYKQDTASRHIGPMAQDFYAAFGVGPDDKHITTVDEGGVALAAIQGLNQIVKEKDAKIENLEKRLTELEQLVKGLAQKN